MLDIKNGIDKSGITIRILRSNRRSMVGRVLHDASIEVRAPFLMTNERINEWLDKYESKFLLLIDECRKINAYISEHPFCYGGEVLYKGEWTPIKEAESDNHGYVALMQNDVIVIKPGLSEAEMRVHIERLFLDLSKPMLEEILHLYSESMGVSYKTWTIGNARKTHGSCDSNKKITLSWRIVMMSKSVIEYIIVHELAHLKYMNHSKAFHGEVASVLPDWKERKIAQSKYSQILRCGGWM